MDVCLNSADMHLEEIRDLQNEQNHRHDNKGDTYIYDMYSDAQVSQKLKEEQNHLKGELAKYADAQHQLVEHTAEFEAIGRPVKKCAALAAHQMD